MENLSDSLVVLVTGGATGIGREMATRFARDGHRVHVCDIDPAAIEALLADTSQVTASVADVAEVADVDRVFDDIAERYGQLDVLVNNAGIAGPTAAAEDIEPAEWDRTIAVSLSGQFYCLRRAIPMIRESSSGSILFVASNAALFGFPLRLAYAASKWALVGMTKTLAMELGVDGIRVNAICPGSVSGPRIDAVIERDAAQRGKTPEDIRCLYERQSSLRCFVEAEDVAALANFLCSREGAKISGQTIGVDGHTESLSNWMD